MAEEKRNYSRVRTSLEAWFRQLHDADAQPIFRENIAPADLTASLKASGLTETASAFLQTMNSKLDAILGILSRDELLEDFPLKAEVYEIGGGGIRFQSTALFAAGEYLEAVLVLGKLPLRLASAIGRVGRDERPGTPGENGALRHWAFEFTRIREQDLDEVVRYVLQEERRQIREVKLA